jgi:hypothetical protein
MLTISDVGSFNHYHLMLMELHAAVITKTWLKLAATSYQSSSSESDIAQRKNLTLEAQPAVTRCQRLLLKNPPPAASNHSPRPFI